MYIFIGSIDLSSVSYDCPIGFWNCFDDVAITVFHLISIAVLFYATLIPPTNNLIADLFNLAKTH